MKWGERSRDEDLIGLRRKKIHKNSLKIAVKSIMIDLKDQYLHSVI